MAQASDKAFQGFNTMLAYQGDSLRPAFQQLNGSALWPRWGRECSCPLRRLFDKSRSGPFKFCLYGITSPTYQAVSFAPLIVARANSRYASIQNHYDWVTSNARIIWQINQNFAPRRTKPAISIWTSIRKALMATERAGGSHVLTFAPTFKMQSVDGLL